MGLGCHAFMWRLLIKPVTFLNHLERSQCLLRLIVVIEMRCQIADEKQEKAYGCNNPNQRADLRICSLLSCRAESENSHSNVSRDLIRSFPIRSTCSTSRQRRGFPSRSILDFVQNDSLARNVHCASLHARDPAHGAPSPPAIFSGNAVR